MPVRPSPTVRGRRLRYELRRLREQRNLTIEQVAERSGGDWTASAISRWERGDRRIRPVDLRALLDIYEVRGSERDEMLGLAREARTRGWWQSYRGDAVPEWFETYLGLESEAATIREYDAELIPGIFQTEDYYRAFMQAAPPAGDDQTIERMVSVRTARQERLTGDDPPEVWVVLNEATIRRVVGGSEVMRRQLEHVATLAERPNISVQVLQFRSGAHPAMDGSFTILGFPEPLDPDVVYLEGKMGSLYLEKKPEVDRYRAVFQHLVAAALGPQESRTLISEAAAALG
jgi:transcriptional regulator with XRE-family HTH domain